MNSKPPSLALRILCACRRRQIQFPSFTNCLVMALSGSKTEKQPRRRQAGASARANFDISAWRDRNLHKLNTAVAALYQRTIVELILRQKHIQDTHDGRHIPLTVDPDHALFDPHRGHSYISNSIRTSRYTVWDFVPKQLLFQFSRVGNFYFLCVGVPQMVCCLALSTTPLRALY